MFNGLLLSKQPLFTFKTLEGQTTIAAFIIIGILLLGALIVYFAKREYSKNYAYAALGIGLVFAFVSIIRFAVVAWKDEYHAEYQNWYAIIGALVAVTIIALSFLAKKFRDINSEVESDVGSSKKVKIINVISFVIFGLLLLGAVILLAYSIVLQGGITKMNLETYRIERTPGLLIAFSIYLLITSVAVYMLFVKKKNKEVFDTKMLVHAAISIALSFALSYVKLFRMPQAGSVTLGSIVPICLFAYMYGFRKGALIAVIHGVLQTISDPWVIHPLQAIIDYPIAFGLLSLAGLLKNVKLPKQVGFALGILAGGLGRYTAHVISGATYFYIYAPEGQNAWVYSLGYNLVIIADFAIAMVLGALLLTSPQIQKIVKHNQERFKVDLSVGETA